MAELSSTHDYDKSSMTPNNNNFAATSSSQNTPLSALRPLPPHVSISRITEPTLPSFRRLLSTILPIPYPNNFFTSILPSSALARIAIWTTSTTSNPSPQPAGIVVAGIRCRIEPLPPLSPSDSAFSSAAPTQLYIQTLATLSPYRGHGLASHLLAEVLSEAMRDNRGLESVYAHVWEANEEALEWYARRGFVVEGEIVQGYYRRLKPSGAWVVRRRTGVRDWVALEGEGR